MSSSRQRGRPADPRVERDVRAAVSAELAEHGWRGVSVERVAARAGVARTTIYRRYGSAEGLLLLMMGDIYARVPVADTGSLREDLIALMRGVERVWRAPEHAAYLAAIIAATHVDPGLARAYAEQFAQRRNATSMIVIRAKERGELHADSDGDLLLDLLAGIAAQRVLLRQMPLGRQLATHVVDALLVGFLPRT